MTDIIDTLAGLSADHPVAVARRRRSDAVAYAQASFEALLEPGDEADFSLAERYAIAAYVAGLHRQVGPQEWYADLLGDVAPDLAGPIAAAAQADGVRGPYGTFREPELADFSAPGAFALHDAPTPRLAAALDVAHLMVLHPRDARPEVIGRLVQAGWSPDGIVSLTQLVAFLSYQLRLVRGLEVLAGIPGAAPYEEGGLSLGAQRPEWPTEGVLTYPDLVRPRRFVAHALRWRPWVAPLERAELTQVHIDALVKPERAADAYFRLLARDPAALKARTLVDLDTFYNTDGGLGRTERELAATVVSRFNGCVYCASVHQARTKEESGDAAGAAVVDRLLYDGVAADLGSQRWNTIRDLAVALKTTPVALTTEHLAGLSIEEAIDAISAAAFFNWANRLMLVLGEPEVPARFA